MRHPVILTVPTVPYILIIPYFLLASKAKHSFRFRRGSGKSRGKTLGLRADKFDPGSCTFNLGRKTSVGSLLEFAKGILLMADLEAILCQKEMCLAYLVTLILGIGIPSCFQECFGASSSQE
jgi:hypothetical protein